MNDRDVFGKHKHVNSAFTLSSLAVYRAGFCSDVVSLSPAGASNIKLAMILLFDVDD